MSRAIIEAGTISHGTMQPRDLIPAFMHALEDNGAGDVAMRLTNKYQAEYGWPVDFHGLRPDDETLDSRPPDAASELISDLFDALNELAPPFHYFGSHPGDGADYGFWVDHDAIQESIGFAQRLGESEYHINLGEEILWHVNDHGNVTGWAMSELSGTPFLEVV